MSCMDVGTKQGLGAFNHSEQGIVASMWYAVLSFHTMLKKEGFKGLESKCTKKSKTHRTGSDGWKCNQRMAAKLSHTSLKHEHENQYMYSEQWRTLPVRFVNTHLCLCPVRYLGMVLNSSSCILQKTAVLVCTPDINLLSTTESTVSTLLLTCVVWMRIPHIRRDTHTHSKHFSSCSSAWNRN
jgi:hypothetical protein